MFQLQKGMLCITTDLGVCDDCAPVDAFVVSSRKCEVDHDVEGKRKVYEAVLVADLFAQVTVTLHIHNLNTNMNASAGFNCRMA